MEETLIDRMESKDFVGFWKRVLISFLDVFILAVPLLLLYYVSNSLAVHWESEIPIITRWILMNMFYIFMIVKFGGTPGRLILKARIVNEAGNYPTVKQALIRCSFLLLGTVFSIIDNLNQFNYSFDSVQLSDLAQLASDLDAILGWVIIVDCLFVVFNKQNRALHDLMAGTYVVKKSALSILD
ncbi:RDD family protein [Paenibacillus sp. sgz500958]|uniref:RDD family protein n=1 Tax=Paenibacillus sp. sgz500958 TaxID=3242475 RepID=UPI0036D3F3D2